MSFLDDLIRLSAPPVEAGVSLLDSALRGTQSAISRALGTEAARTEPPVDGPRDVDEATSELANRLLRNLRRTSWRPGELPEAARQLAVDAAASFRFRDPRKWLGLPLQLPLSLATLATQETLRGLATVQSMPAERLGDFAAFVVEIFTDLHVYFSLQYREELDHWRSRLARDPEDARARFELGRTFIKCGLYAEAAAELEALVEQPAWQRRALYEKMIAHYRAGEYARAIAAGAGSLALDPERPVTRYWLFLAAEAAGGYPDSVPPALRMEARDGFHPSPVELADVAAEIGLDKTSGGRGSAVFDVDGDGHLDVVFAGAHAGCSVFLNRGDGTFDDVSTGSGLDRSVYAFALAAGDYDNDGNVDLYVSSLGFYNGRGALMKNNGVGEDGRVTFTDVTDEAGLADWGPGFTATWVDFDNDGWLDLFLTHNLGGLFDRKVPNRLFRNNGARGAPGTFTDVTAESGIETAWMSIGACWGDFRNCGLQDLFVSNLGRAQLFLNNGDGSFTDVSREAGIDRPAIGSACFACDIDDDGWLDIVQLTYSRPADYVHTLRTGAGPPAGSPLRVWRNNRDGRGGVPSFSDIAPDLGITGCWGTMSANAGDFDNDGRIDLFLGNGDPAMDRSEASVLLRNDGQGFRNVSFAAGLPFTGKGHGVNLADLTGDGRLHLIVASGGLYPGDLLTNAVYRPRELPGNYLNVRLVGTRSNRDAIGARVALTAGGRTQHRLVSGGSSFGCLPFEQHFGLGGLTIVDGLEIRWPSGRIQKLAELPVNDTVRIVEGEEGWEPVVRKA